MTRQRKRGWASRGGMWQKGKYMGDTNGRQGYFSKFCLCRLKVMFSLMTRAIFSSWHKRGRHFLSEREMYALIINQKVKGKQFSLVLFSPVSVVSQKLSAQNNPMPKGHILGWHILVPFRTLVRVWTFETKRTECKFQFHYILAL